MDDATKEYVRNRAEGRCEYCGNLEQYFTQLFQIEHIRPKCHLGSNDETNLALSCRRCNLHKGTNLAGIDPQTEELTRLFNPRSDTWTEHFQQKHSGRDYWLNSHWTNNDIRFEYEYPSAYRASSSHCNA